MDLWTKFHCAKNHIALAQHFKTLWVSAPMSMPLVQQPPPVTVTQQQPDSSGHASVGPVIAVVLVIIILGIIAVMIGRLCTGRRIMGYGQYDIESWIETKCSSCIDGTISASPSAPTANANASASPQQVPPNVDS